MMEFFDKLKQAQQVQTCCACFFVGGGIPAPFLQCRRSDRLCGPPEDTL